MTDVSKTSVKRKQRDAEREDFIKHKEENEIAALARARQQAKDALTAITAIKTLQQIVPSWPRHERRALAAALRQGGNGYTKNTRDHGRDE